MDENPLEDAEERIHKKSKVCGHIWSMYEVLYILLFLAGTTMLLMHQFIPAPLVLPSVAPTPAGMSEAPTLAGLTVAPTPNNATASGASKWYPPPVVSAVLQLIASAVALALMWNFVAIKMLSMSSDQLEEDLFRLQNENERAKNLQNEKKRNQEEMENKLQGLEKAALMLKGSVQSLKDVQDAEKEMIAEQEELLDKRKVLAILMITDLENLNEATLQTSQQELRQLIVLNFQGFSVESGGEIQTGSKQWDGLLDIMVKTGMEVNEDKIRRRFPDKIEDIDFKEWIDTEVDLHFRKLRAAITDNVVVKDLLTQEMIRAGIPSGKKDH